VLTTYHRGNYLIQVVLVAVMELMEHLDRLTKRLAIMPSIARTISVLIPSSNDYI